jgi:hypothetical protein
MLKREITTGTPHDVFGVRLDDVLRKPAAAQDEVIFDSRIADLKYHSHIKFKFRKASPQAMLF